MNSTILIVGASSGIGKETALKFSKKQMESSSLFKKY